MTILQQISLSIPLAHAELGTRNIKLSSTSNVHEEEEATTTEMKGASSANFCIKVSDLFTKALHSTLQ